VSIIDRILRAGEGRTLRRLKPAVTHCNRRIAAAEMIARRWL